VRRKIFLTLSNVVHLGNNSGLCPSSFVDMLLLFLYKKTIACSAAMQWKEIYITANDCKDVFGILRHVQPISSLRKLKKYYWQKMKIFYEQRSTLSTSVY